MTIIYSSPLEGLVSIDYKEAGNKGRSFIWEQRWEDAVRAFQIAISGLPNEPDLYDGLATAYRGLNQLDKALENYQMAARLSKGEAIYMSQVADVQEQLGQYQNAAQTYMVLGEMKLRDRRLDEAVDRWLMAVSLDPTLLKAHQRLAAVYARQKQIEQAVNEYMIVARLYEKQNDAGRALEACQTALQLDSRNPDVRTAIELLQHGEKAFASEQSIADAPRPRRLETLLGEDKPKRRIIAPAVEAQRLARERLAEEIFSDSGVGDEMARMQRMTLISQALDYQTRGLLDQAIDGYEQAIRTGLNSTAAYYNLGLLCLERNAYNKALNAFNRAVEERAYRLGSHFGLMEVYRANGDYPEAVRNGIVVLREVDLTTVPAPKHGRVHELYTALEQDLLGAKATDKAVNFCQSLTDFLGQEKWQAEVRSARARLDQMAGQGGLMILGDILTAGSSQVLELLYNAQIHAQEGLYATAMEEVYGAINYSPNYLPAHMQMADLLLKQRRIGPATQKFLVLARAYQTRGDLNGAFYAFERAVEASPIDVETRENLIKLLLKHGAIDRAIEQYIGLGQAHYQLAQAGKARDIYVQGLKLAGQSSNEKKWRIQLLRLIGDMDIQRLEWKGAMPIYRELRRLDPQDEQIALTLVDLLYKLGQTEQALRELDRYLVQLAKSGRGAQLVTVLEKIVERRPIEPALVDRLSRLYVQQKRVPQAIAVLDKLGEAQLDAGQNDAAVVTINKILSLKPPNRSDYQKLLQQIKQ